MSFRAFNFILHLFILFYYYFTYLCTQEEYEMKQRINIAWTLIMVCMIMLTASVLPHHHHQGLICLQHDNTEQTCETSTQENSHKSSCKDCCITKFNCFRSDTDDSMEPHFSFESILFTLTDIYLLPLRFKEDLVNTFTFYYHERLHCRHISAAIGLRAPPAFA